MKSMTKKEFWRVAEPARGALIAFAQRLVQTPSLSGHEASIAALVRAEMARLGYDHVWTDKVGNVIGRVAGGSGPSLMLNGHLDHVDAGDPARWPHPPFGGEIHDGALWGRGSVDMKGALAAMIYAGHLVRQMGRPLPGDLFVSAVVDEEVGGLGARHLAETVPTARAVVGEASGNHLRRGHRGRVELAAHFAGRSVHASMPDLGANPHFSMARFIDGLHTLPMAADPDYGASTVAPTWVSSEPQSANVTPAALHLVLDWRNIPGEGRDDIVPKLEKLLADSLEGGCTGRIEVAIKNLVSYTGVSVSYPDEFPSFTTDLDHPYLAQARAALNAALGRDVEVGTWRFATDGGHLSAVGVTVLGFGPGDDRIAHTVEEHLPLDQLFESVVGYMALSLI